MKKRIILTVLVLICLLTLSACGCKHETWNEADCVNPKTCAECGETEGAPLGHSWLAATCDAAKTCENCGEVEGEALGHSWVEASCAAPKTCTGCGLTEGEALEHTWVEATTEAPKTCTGCGATEGERIITDERFTTAATKDLHGKWSCEISLDEETMATLAGIDDLNISVGFILNVEFSNSGEFTMALALADEEAFKTAMKDYLVDALYAELADAGLDKDAADAAVQQAYNMTIQEYAAQAVNQMNFNEMLSSANTTGVYYVENGIFYSSSHWSSNMEALPYTLEGDTLTLNGDLAELGLDKLVFTRVTE